ncbi:MULTISPECIES: MFS transporter [unclassified Streptomyces]|uniref:MFS transporter n=1 Tax=unclassified Streptomyces TaxID=2593676 RepID=UPI0033C62604
MTEFTESVDIPRAAPTIATPRRGALIAVAAVLATVTNAVAFMLPPLLPLIQEQFGLGVAASAWIFTALTLGGGAGFVLLPRLTDVLDDRTTSLLSGGFLIVGALVPAIGNSYPTLLVGSALLGFGGAAQLLPLSFLRRHLTDGAVATAVSVLIMATGSGTVLGMVGGGLTVKYLSLASFFYILAAAFAATTVALLIIVPSSRPESSGRIGILGTMWLIAWVTAVLLALTQGLTWSGTAILALLAAGVVGAVLWGLVQRRSAKAVFDVKLLKKPLVSPACFAAGMFGAVDAAFLLLVAYYAQTPAEVGYGLGVDALGTGLLMLPFALMMFVGGKAAERAVQKGRPATVLVIGTVVSIVGLGWLAFAHEQKWQYLVGAAFVGLGSRVGYSGAFAVPQLVVPEEKAGMAAGMAGTTMAIGFAFGSAVVTTLLTFDTIPKIGLPKEYLYTVGYEVTVGLSLLVLVVTLISRLRHGGELKASTVEA